MQFGFEKIAVPARQDKPRTLGLTMMIDWGLGLARQADTLDSAGLYIDVVKIAASIPRIMPREVLVKKLKKYREHGITASTGGLFTELAYKQGTYADLLEDAKAVGFAAVEVSDNLVRYPPGAKAKLIRECAASGLKAYGEVGRKEGALDDAAFLADIDDCLQAGAAAVYLEAYELFAQGEVRTRLIEAIGKRFPQERIVYELPVVILPGVHREFKHRITALLVKTFGTQVNLANLEWDELYITEMVRRGMAGDTSHPEGAYRLAGFEPGSEG